jgi:hypothetical protein
LPTSVLLEQTQAGNSGVQHSATCMQTTGSPLMWQLLCFKLACHMPEHGVLDSNAFQQSFFKQLHVAVVAESSALAVILQEVIYIACISAFKKLGIKCCKGQNQHE